MDARQWHLKRIGVIGFIICACVAGSIQQPPALPHSSGSSSIDGSVRAPLLWLVRHHPD